MWCAPLRMFVVSCRARRSCVRAPLPAAPHTPIRRGRSHRHTRESDIIPDIIPPGCQAWPTDATMSSPSFRPAVPSVTAALTAAFAPVVGRRSGGRRSGACARRYCKQTTPDPTDGSAKWTSYETVYECAPCKLTMVRPRQLAPPVLALRVTRHSRLASLASRASLASLAPLASRDRLDGRRRAMTGEGGSNRSANDDSRIVVGPGIALVVVTLRSGHRRP